MSSKKAKSTEVIFRSKLKIYNEIEYTCPSCKTTFIEYFFDKNVTRFKCNCGQEIIVKCKKERGGITELNNEVFNLRKLIHWFTSHLCSSYKGASRETQEHIDRLFCEYNKRWKEIIKRLVNNNFLKE